MGLRGAFQYADREEADRMNLNRRSFFGLIPAVPAVALAKKRSSGGLLDPAEAIDPKYLSTGVAITRAAKREGEMVYLAFLRLGLLAPGEKVSKADYDLAITVMGDRRQWTDTDLAFALWPYYSNVFRSYPPAQGFAAQR